MSFFKELKRRSVFRVAVAYLVGAWLLLQVGATLAPALHLPDWVDTLLAFFLLLGFPVALFLAWAFELTPEGIKRDTGIVPGEAPRAVAGRKLDRLIIVVLVLAVAYFALDKYVLSVPRQTTSELAPAQQAERAAAPAKSIAVLPFVNMSSDPEQEYFSDGLTEELLNLLAGIADLKVAARTSSFFYKGKLGEIPLLEIARQLEVAHVLEGSVRKSGDKIRVTAQLIKVDDGFHLWSATYDRTLDDVFAIQDEIAGAVVEQLKITLLGATPRARVIDTESYQLALRGRFLFNRRAEGDLQRALELFERAVEIDPGNAAAWTGMVPLYLWFVDPPDLLRARAAVEKALQLEPENPEVTARLAMLLIWEGRIEEGMALFDKALEEHPDNPLLLSMISGRRLGLGDVAGAVEYQRRAVAADPLHIVNLGNLASNLIMAGQLEEAEIYAAKVLELAPGTPSGQFVLAEIRLLQGRAEEAWELIQATPPEEDLEDEEDRRDKLILTGAAQYSLGDDAASRDTLQAFRSQFAGETPMGMAYLHAWRGEHDAAFEWLARSLEQYPDLEGQAVLQSWLWSLRDDPRWDELMQRWPDYREFEVPR
jgi:adenylate cyclase